MNIPGFLTAPGRKSFFIRLVAHFAAGALLFLLIIMSLRAVMNAVNRTSFISQRLDDYPRLYDNYVRENSEWWEWWQDRDYEKRADLGVIIFTSDKTHVNERDRLEYIAGILGAEEARIVDDGEDVTVREHDSDVITSSHHLPDGRVLVLVFHGQQKDSRMSIHENDDVFMRSLQTGLEGHILVLHDDELSVCPEDEEGANIKAMVSYMLESGKMQPATLKAEASNSENGVAMHIRRNSGTSSIPSWRYLLYSAAYSNNDDLVVYAVKIDDLVRFGHKRSWSLWFLCTMLSILLGICLYRTRLYHAADEQIPAADRMHPARVRGASAFFVATLLLFLSVLFIQLLSDVNQSAEAAENEAVYVKNVINEESDRAWIIEDEFDSMYTKRLETTAKLISDNPAISGMNYLDELCSALGGKMLSVYDNDGNLVASNRPLQLDETARYTESFATLTDSDGNDVGTLMLTRSEEKDTDRIYRDWISDKDGTVSGLVELRVDPDQLDELLVDTKMEEVIGDIDLLDSMHIVVIENSKDHKIIGGSYSNWIGDKAEEHGILSQYFYDGYEGIVNFEGNKCYSSVFEYDNCFVVIGSEDLPMLVFLIGVIFLFIVLLLVMTFFIYRPLSVRLYDFQRNEYLTQSTDVPARSEYPLVWEFLRGFMLSVFALSAILYFISKGNPTGLTYNVVRGTWVRGVSVVTVTTCVMLISVVFAAQELINIICARLSGFLSPKGQTIAKLIDSGTAYIGAIVMIIYTLSMLGVNTATLVGGVGATALVFTLGANSLIADVLAGLFIIFEGDFTVGDVVVVDDFRGIVTDISMRTTKLMDDNTKDIRIINNSQIKQLVNQSREDSIVIVDIDLLPGVVLEEAEEKIREGIRALPEKYPEIIGTPQYWGVSKLPSKNSFSGKIGNATLRAAFGCKENDKEMLTYKVYRDLTRVVQKANERPEAVIEAEKKEEEARLSKRNVNI